MINNKDVQKPALEFIGKYIITADVKLKTALHIGGTEEGFEIGGIDNPIIKDKMTGIPYIPGSSLKGKMRSLLVWANDQVNLQQNKRNKNEWEGIDKNDPTQQIFRVFGLPAEKHQVKEIGNVAGPTRLTVRDAYPEESQVKEWEKYMGEKIYTEVKTENAIDRLTSAATPRSIERVPAGSAFKAEFIYDVYCKNDIKEGLKKLFQGMRLLEDSALGGGGSRGSGKIKFEGIKIEARDKSFYIGGESSELNKIELDNHSTPDKIIENYDTIFQLNNKK